MLQVAYTGHAPPASADQQLKLDLAIVTEHQGRPVALSDGEVLRSQIDAYALILRPRCDGYLYVFQMPPPSQSPRRHCQA